MPTPPPFTGEPPTVIEETVTDLDITYVGRFPDSLTFRAEDIFTYTDRVLILRFKDTEEVITCERHNILNWRTRQRVHRTYVDKDGKPIRLPGAIQP